VENFEALRQRQTSDTFVDPSDTPRRVNLLNWDGKGSAADLMPPRSSSSSPDSGDEPSAEGDR
jgi:nitrate reductase beta subunit